MQFPKPKRPKLAQLPYYTLIITSVLLIGVGKLIDGSFTWRSFATSTFWMSTFYTLGGNICITLGAFQRRLFLLKGNIPEINECEEFIHGFTKSGDENEMFPYYIDEVYNLQNKKEAWRKKINRKYFKAFSKNKKKQIQKYKEMLTDDYINANIKYIKVKYFFIKPSTVITGYTPKEEDKPYGSSIGYIFKNLSPKYLISIGITLILSSFVVQVNKDEATLTFIYKLLANCMGLAMNFVAGDEFAYQYIKEYILTKLKFQVGVIKSYLAWKLKRGA